LRVVPHLDSHNALVFPIMEYILNSSQVLKIGRTTADRRSSSNSMTFRSKVVSRRHAEIFVQNEKVYIRDMQSSSGTFLNNRRLCSANQISEPFEIHNNDIIQLGVDYQGGTQEIYRCVKMKIELNKINISKVSHRAFNRSKRLNIGSIIGECCICLFAIAPFQALFITPCSHTFHYKCLRPLLANHPGFLCPLCRSYADLDKNVSLEVE
ncbi:SMAD/FHA domain-containing protein, partial [Blakeslea trispora]